MERLKEGGGIFSEPTHIRDIKRRRGGVKVTSGQYMAQIMSTLSLCQIFQNRTSFNLLRAVL